MIQGKGLKHYNASIWMLFSFFQFVQAFSCKNSSFTLLSGSKQTSRRLLRFRFFPTPTELIVTPFHLLISKKLTVVTSSSVHFLYLLVLFTLKFHRKMECFSIYLAEPRKSHGSTAVSRRKVSQIYASFEEDPEI